MPSKTAKAWQKSNYIQMPLGLVPETFAQHDKIWSSCNRRPVTYSLFRKKVTITSGIPRGTLEIVIQEVLWSIRGSYSAYEVLSIPLTNVKWHSDPQGSTGQPVTVTYQLTRLSTNFHDRDTRLDLHRITSGFHGAFAKDVASHWGTLTLPDTMFRSPF